MSEAQLRALLSEARGWQIVDLFRVQSLFELTNSKPTKSSARPGTRGQLARGRWPGGARIGRARQHGLASGP